MSRHVDLRAVLVAAVAVGWAVAPIVAQQNPYLGRWNITGTGENSGVYWLEVKEDGGKLTGMFLNRGGHPLPLAGDQDRERRTDSSRCRRRRSGPGPEFHARAQGDKLTGSVKLADRTVEFSGARPPKWAPADANAAHKFGTPVDALRRQVDGRLGRADQEPADGLDDCRRRDDQHAAGQQPGLEAEVPGLQDSRGIQARDEQQQRHLHPRTLRAAGARRLRQAKRSSAVTCPSTAWHTPLVNASKPAGEWQTMEATVVGNKVTVVLNGQKVQDNVTLEAITGGALDANESEPGPIMLQGDHEKVWYRNVTVTPILDARP